LLETQLFVRTSRSVALTAAGATLHDRARELLAQAARDVDEVVRIGRGEQGRLDVGFVTSALALGPIESVRASVTPHASRRAPRCSVDA